MVKRQTVWLSTMMVLSLMLIGYYTMNNGDGTTGLGTTDPSKTVVVPPTTEGVTPPDTSKSTTGKTPASSTMSGSHQTNSSGQSQTNSGKSTGTPSSGSDWFASYQTTVETNLSQKEEGYLAVINSNSASSDQVAAAQQKVTALQNIVGGLKSAEDQITGEGYTNCVIDPIPNGQNALSKARVYVQTKALQATDAVRIMNIVSQQLSIPITDVQVIAHK